MSLWNKPLFPLDGSQRSLDAVQYCRPWLESAECVPLLHVVDPDPELVDVPGCFDGPAARDYLMGIAGGMNGLQERADYLVEAGHAAETIIDVAKREGATLIAIATHGRGGVLKWALGSVAEKVSRASEVPVLLVPKSTRGRTERVRHILVPVDGSERALSLVSDLAALAKAHAIRLTLVHFVGRHGSATAAEKGHNMLYRARCAFEDAGVLPKVRLLFAPAAEGIVDYDELAEPDEPPVDMIAMTTHGRTGLLRWALGSVTERVMRHTRVPLLTVRCT